MDLAIAALEGPDVDRGRAVMIGVLWPGHTALIRRGGADGFTGVKHTGCREAKRA